MAPARSTFGAVSFGNSSTPRYRGGEAAGLIPIDPESLAIDGEKLAAKAVEHEGEKKPSTSPAASAYDGLVRNADGTYTAVETYTGAEVKSGTAASVPPNEHSTVQSIQDSPRRRPSTGARFRSRAPSSSG